MLFEVVGCKSLAELLLATHEERTMLLFTQKIAQVPVMVGQFSIKVQNSVTASYQSYLQYHLNCKNLIFYIC